MPVSTVNNTDMVITMLTVHLTKGGDEYIRRMGERAGV